MYVPRQFEEQGIDAMHGLIREHPLATLVAMTPQGLDANHIPLHLSERPASFGTLTGHVARSNPIWRDYRPDVEVLAIFHGPEAYITPSWYPSTSGRVVPTWNYAAVHAYGTLRVIDDACWIRNRLEALTDHNEAGFAKKWSLSDAPDEFTAKLIESVVGIEIVISRLSGKWKTSQNQPPENRTGVIEGLSGCGKCGAAEMAELVRERGQR